VLIYAYWKREEKDEEDKIYEMETVKGDDYERRHLHHQCHLN